MEQHKVKVIVKSITGRIISETEYDFDKNLDKLVATVDTAQVMKTGGNIEGVMQQVADLLQMVIAKNLPLIVVPEFIKLEFIKLESIIVQEGEIENDEEKDSERSN